MIDILEYGTPYQISPSIFFISIPQMFCIVAQRHSCFPPCFIYRVGIIAVDVLPQPKFFIQEVLVSFIEQLQFWLLVVEADKRLVILQCFEKADHT